MIEHSVDAQNLKFYLDQPVFSGLVSKGFKVIDVYSHSLKSLGLVENFYSVTLTYPDYSSKQELAKLFHVFTKSEIADFPIDRPRPRVGQLVIKLPFEGVQIKSFSVK
ncbi:hypothetical protein HUU53_00825 [Candidatus Micrarchaeota archaeon]|nr:hypothetical protein [Candidatus Micrarchaeota archaeon]